MYACTVGDRDVLNTTHDAWESSWLFAFDRGWRPTPAPCNEVEVIDEPSAIRLSEVITSDLSVIMDADDREAAADIARFAHRGAFMVDVEEL